MFRAYCIYLDSHYNSQYLQGRTMKTRYDEIIDGLTAFVGVILVSHTAANILITIFP